VKYAGREWGLKRGDQYPISWIPIGTPEPNGIDQDHPGFWTWASSSTADVTMFAMITLVSDARVLFSIGYMADKR